MFSGMKGGRSPPCTCVSLCRRRGVGGHAPPRIFRDSALTSDAFFFLSKFKGGRNVGKGGQMPPPPPPP